MCIWSSIIYQYIWKMQLTYQCFSFESVHGESMLKMGWVVKKWNFSFWMEINWSKCILMISLYIWLSIYTNNEILCINWKFDLSSRGVLGRIYALSIEVLCKTQFTPNIIPPKHAEQDQIDAKWLEKNVCFLSWGSSRKADRSLLIVNKRLKETENLILLM